MTKKQIEMAKAILEAAKKITSETFRIVFYEKDKTQTTTILNIMEADTKDAFIKSGKFRAAINNVVNNTIIEGTTEYSVEPVGESKAQERTKTPNKKENKMDAVKFEMEENFIINPKDVVWHKWGKHVKASPAKEAVPATEAIAKVKAVKAVKAAKAIKEVKDAEGNITQEAVAAVKAIKAVEAVKGVPAIAEQPAVPAVEESHEMYMKAKTQKIAEQVAARMEDQGLAVVSPIAKEKDFFTLSFAASDPKIIRAAFKAVKDKAGYNKDGLDAQKAADKAAKKAELDAIKAANKAEKEAKEKADAEAKEKDAGSTEDNTEKDEGAGWPDGFDKE